MTMRLLDARKVAEALVEELRPHCARVEIAGSVRRRKAEVKDIELVAVPAFSHTTDSASLFSETVSVNLLHQWAMRSTKVFWIKPGTDKIIPWPPKPEGKYWCGLVGAGSANDPAKLDLFIASPDNYGLIFTIRTGSKEFSAALLGYAKNHTPYQSERSYYEERPELEGKPEGGWLVEKATGNRVATPDERGLFELLGLQYVEPGLRIDGRAIRRK